MSTDIKALQAEARSLAKIAETGDATEEQLARITEISEVLSNRKSQAEAAAKLLSMTDIEEVVNKSDENVKKDLGSAFIRSTEAGSRSRTRKVEGEFDVRAITTSTIVTNPTLVPVASPAPRTPLANLVTIERVNTTSVDVVVEVVTDNSASVLEGNLKPETTIDFVPTTLVLETLAHHVDVSRQATEDDARIEGIINTTLLNGLARLAEKKIAAAIASNVNIATTDAASLLDAIRFAAAAVETRDFTPTTVLLNPFDLALLDTEAAGQFRSIERNGSFFGLNVVTSSEITPGEAFVGDFANAVKWYDRGTAGVYTTDADQDKFLRNIITVLAETRAVASVERPAAIEKAIITPAE
jgi:HK97 family phage major capsid protein